jgi:hypothetical protein
MIPKRVEGATRVLGKSQGFLGLPIRDAVMEGVDPVMISAWEPTNDELIALARGASVYLMIVGSLHPPVRLMVGAPPDSAVMMET